MYNLLIVTYLWCLCDYIIYFLSVLFHGDLSVAITALYHLKEDIINNEIIIRFYGFIVCFCQPIKRYSTMRNLLIRLSVTRQFSDGNIDCILTCKSKAKTTACYSSCLNPSVIRPQ